jgi:aryl-alcohol dehydrogenase-like predicted oxidoreductase
MLAKSPCVLPIPGARRVETIVDCAGATEIALGPSDLAAVEASFSGH